MNSISSATARRIRVLHAVAVACIPCAFLGALLPKLLPPPPPDWLAFAPLLWFFGFLALGMFGSWAIEWRTIRMIDPDPEVRRRVTRLSWTRPIGTFLALDELLRVAEKR